MAYCFPPRGFPAPQTGVQPSPNNPNLNSNQQTISSPSSFSPSGENSSAYTFSPNKSTPHQFPPNRGTPHQFPPRGPNRQQFNNGYQNPWSNSNKPPNGHNFRGPQGNNPRHQFPPQFDAGYNFQGRPRFGHHRGGGRGGGGNNRKGKNKQQSQKMDQNGNNVKAKKDKELKYNCDVCDRGFKTEDLLNVHISEHVKCTTPGCKFEAHVKVVQLHKKLQHTGKYKVQWLETEDEINRWRAERRKNYPTAANIDKKQSQQNRKEKSGAVLQTKQFGKMQKSSKKWKGNDNFYSNKHNEVPPTDFHTSSKTAEHPARTNEANKRTLKRQGSSDDAVQPKQAKVTVVRDGEKSSKMKNGGTFGGQMANTGDPLSLFAADEQESDNKPDVAVSIQQAEVHLAPSGSIGSLGTLAAAYGDDSSTSADDKSDDEDVKVAEKEEEKQAQEERGVSKVAEQQQPGRQNLRQRQEGERRQGNSRQQQRKKKGNRHDSRQRKATLLEMLLAPDIRHERNVLLQCVRYVVYQNFFQESITR